MEGFSSSFNESEIYFNKLSQNDTPLMESNFYSKNGSKVPFGFSFTSENNKYWHSVESFRAVLQTAGLLS